VGQQFFGYAGDTGCTDQMIGLDHADCILVRSGKKLRRDARWHKFVFDFGQEERILCRMIWMIKMDCTSTTIDLTRKAEGTTCRRGTTHDGYVSCGCFSYDY
jgi:hypothetical protein